MINNDMGQKDENLDEERSKAERPNESTGIYVRGFLKITDPESGETLIETGN